MVLVRDEFLHGRYQRWYYTVGTELYKSNPESTLGQTEPVNHIPHVIPRPEHCISRSNISENAVKVLYRLKKAGFAAYLVGGGVRDLLLGRQPKDFDIATDAHPEEVRGLFRNCRLIGRRFRLAHVHFKDEIIEVATFRAAPTEQAGETHLQDGRLVRDNLYGTMDEDAWRRDFTVNALYYNIRDFSVVDHVGGMEDLEAGTLRVIGDPEQRYREDPVRMLRAVRFATKLGFRLEGGTEAGLRRLGHLLDDIPPARLFEEVLKLFQTGFAQQNFEMLRREGLFEHLFPATDELLERDPYGFHVGVLVRGLANTDARVAEGKPITPAFLFAVLLWGPMLELAAQHRAAGMTELQALYAAGNDVVSMQGERVSVPRRFSLATRDIWAMQARLKRTSGRRPHVLVEHPRFRAGYDFLLLRGEAGEEVDELSSWWTRFQELGEQERSAMSRPARKPKRRRRRRHTSDEVST